MQRQKPNNNNETTENIRTTEMRHTTMQPYTDPVKPSNITKYLYIVCPLASEANDPEYGWFANFENENK